MTRSVAILGTRGYPSYYGGFETLVRKLAPYLVDHDWDVTVYGRGECSADSGRDSRVHTVTTKGIDSRSLSTLSHGLTSCAHAAWRKPDVALVMNVANGFYLPLLKARGIPTAVNVDGIEWERGKWGAGAKAMFRAGARMTARFADHLIYDADAIATRWADDFDRDGTFIPYGGTVPEPSDPLPELADRPYALMVARFVPENSIDEFLTAAEQLSRKWNIAIVGSSGSGSGSELDDRVARLDAANDNVHWFGHVSDDRKLFALWQHAGAYFHGHSAGGTNPALVQAMACGTPTVARDTVYNREVLADAGLFTDPEPTEIARLIDLLLGDRALQKKLREAAQLRQAERYTWDGVCDRYEQTLAELAQPS